MRSDQFEKRLRHVRRQLMSSLLVSFHFLAYSFPVLIILLY